MYLVCQLLNIWLSTLLMWQSGVYQSKVCYFLFLNVSICFPRGPWLHICSRSLCSGSKNFLINVHTPPRSSTCCWIEAAFLPLGLSPLRFIPDSRLQKGVSHGANIHAINPTDNSYPNSFLFQNTVPAFTEQTQCTCCVPKSRLPKGKSHMFSP